MSCSRLFNNFGAANIKAQLPRVFDDFIGGKRSKVLVNVMADSL